MLWHIIPKIIPDCKNEGKLTEQETLYEIRNNLVSEWTIDSLVKKVEGVVLQALGYTAAQEDRSPMKKRRKKRHTPTAAPASCKVALHTSPPKCGHTLKEAEAFLEECLIDAFLPKIWHVTQTSERADAISQEIQKDPHWQARYRHIARTDIAQKYDGVLPIETQFQTDSHTLVSCLNVQEPVEFQPVWHSEIEDGGHVPNPDGSDVFFSIHHEKHMEEIRNWHDIPWEQIGIVPKKTFNRFIKILLKRLEPIVHQIWVYAGGTGTCYTDELDQPLVEGTYLANILKKAKYRKPGGTPNGNSP